ncbi:hypothetical protein [Teichococcus aestuarii]|uniref:hypothetical protein n=1 Tax=Teichococcus aestuarii TaxID=568898 RepID=UPI00361D50D0
MHRTALLCALLALPATTLAQGSPAPASTAPAPAATAPTAPAPAAPAEAGNRLQLVNRTGQDATSLQAVRSGRADWGPTPCRGRCRPTNPSPCAPAPRPAAASTSA